MTQAFLDMLHLFSCAAHGTRPKEKDYNLDEIFQQAARQGILPLVLVSVKRLYKDGARLVQGVALERHINNLRLLVLNNMQKSAIVYDAVKQLADSGIPYCILKGETLAELYSSPECRISGDTDVYVGDEILIKKAIKILKGHGFEFGSKGSNLHHYHADHSIAGVLELHSGLYDELFIDVWFDKQTALTEPYRVVKTHSGSELPTLGITDGLVFLHLHFTKHFLVGGIGIRQLMDMLLYIKKHKNEIDYEKFSKIIKHLKYDKFFNNVMYIGVKHLGFAEEDLYPFAYDEAIASKVLSDIENGGNFGKDEEWRKGFYLIYNEQRFGRFKDEDYAKYMETWDRENTVKTFFLPRKNMERMYPYVAEYRFLLPVAWVHRAIGFAVKLVKRLLRSGKNNDNMQVGEIKERMDLIKELDMI